MDRDKILEAHREKCGRTAHIGDTRTGGFFCKPNRRSYQHLGSFRVSDGIGDGLRAAATNRPNNQSDLAVCGTCIVLAEGRAQKEEDDRA